MSRLPTGAGGWVELVDHALALGDLAEVDWLELKGRLPFSARADRRRSAVVIARAVLALSNRMPDAAAKHVGGHGIVLLGLNGSVLVGAEPVDGAVLHDVLQPYVGEDGPQWDLTWVDHPDGLVLAIVVAPPQWGDRIHACRKSYSADDVRLAVRDGEVFIRVPGMSRLASSHDLFELQRRRDKAPASGAQVTFAYEGDFDRVSTASARDTIIAGVDRVADRLLASLSRPRGGSTSSQSGLLGSIVRPHDDRRTTQEFRAEVEHWRSDCTTQAGDVATELIRHDLGRGRPKLSNDSDRYLEAVQVQVFFPRDARVLAASDSAYCDHGGPFDFMSLLPDRPVNWGSYNLGGMASYRRPAILPSRSLTTNEFDVDETADGVILTWLVGDLRPRATEVASETFALVTDAHREQMAIHWQVTARGIDHVFSGKTTLSSAQERHVHLRWSPPK